MKHSKNLNQINNRLLILCICLCLVQNVSGQVDSLLKYSKNIKLGMNEKLVKSLMTDFISGIHLAPGGLWRYIYDDIIQTKIIYTDRQWNDYEFRYLFKNDKLIYFDLWNYKGTTIFYSQLDSNRLNGLVNGFNKQFNSSDSLNSILNSFSTTVYSLDEPQFSFFLRAEAQDINRLLAYAKSLCPEYSASAIIKILELEKKKKFLTEIQKTDLRIISQLNIRTNFVLGDVSYRLTISEFIDQIRPDLKVLLN